MVDQVYGSELKFHKEFNFNLPAIWVYFHSILDYRIKKVGKDQYK